MSDHRLLRTCAVFLFTCIFLFTNTLRAQENVRQLNTLYNVSKLEDTSYIFNLIEQSRVVKQKQPDSAIILLQKAFKESYRTNFYDGMAYALLGLGVCHIEKGDYQQSIQFFNLAFPYAQKTTTHKKEIAILLYNAMGVPYSCLGDYQSAIACYLKALKEIGEENVVDPSTLVYIYCNLGGIFIETNQYELALSYLKKMEHIALAKNYPDSLLEPLYANIATAYGRKNDLKQDSLYTQKVKVLGEKYNNIKWQQDAASHFGNIALKQERPDKAIPHLEYALSLSNGANTLLNVSILTSLSSAYYQVKDYKRATQFAFLALDKSKTMGLQTNVVSEIYGVIASTYADQGQYTQAYKYLLSYTLLKDSLLSEQRNKAIHQLEVKYRTSEKDKEIAQKKLLITQQEKKIEKRNTWLVSSICGALLVVLLMIAILRNYRNRQKLQQERIRNLQQEQELLHKEKEIDNLKSMITGEEKERSRIARELHDGVVSQLSGTKMRFSTIYEKYKALFHDNDFEQTIEQLKDVMSDLRKTAHNLTPDILIQGGLAEAIRIFCEKINHSSSLHITLHQSGMMPAFDSEFELSVYRMVQELVQNIEKHAKATEVLIQMSAQDELLSITVEDNGIGMDVTRLRNDTGIGLKNVEARVKALNGHWDIQSTVNIGTTVYIEFDISNFLKTEEACV